MFLQVSYARPSSNDIKNANLYVSGLPQTCDAVQLRELFQNFGEIITSKVLVDEKGLSRGVGFVRFDKRKHAELSIDALNNNVPNLPGSLKPLTVKFANPPSQKIQNYVDILAQAKASVTNAGFLQPQSLYSHISTPTAAVMATPAVAGANGITTPPTSFSNGFSTGQSILNGITGIAPQQSATTIPSWCVFVYNLPSDANDLTLFQLFSKYGAIHSVRVITDHEKKCRGYGFVNMAHYEDALGAIFRLNGYCLERGKPLQVSLKRPKCAIGGVKT